MKIRSIAVNDNTAAMLEYLYGNNKAKKQTFIVTGKQIGRAHV